MNLLLHMYLYVGRFGPLCFVSIMFLSCVGVEYSESVNKQQVFSLLVDSVPSKMSIMCCKSVRRSCVPRIIVLPRINVELGDLGLYDNIIMKWIFM